MNRTDLPPRRQTLLVALLCAALLQSACSLIPKEVEAVVVPPPAPTYDSEMAAADESQKKGSAAEALIHLERAAQIDPSKKQPWLRIAQAQFDARNYGPAISAAQEVVQRDNFDVTAKSIMAASGLRVSAFALEQLRDANALGGGTREEAQALARTMRMALGESILPPPVAPAPAEPPRPVSRAKARQATADLAPIPPAGAAARAAPPAAAPARAVEPRPRPAEPSRNPFDALKG